MTTSFDIAPTLIATYSGKLVDLETFGPDDVDLGDIAHALSQSCRWSGATRVFYSVAEHSVRVSIEAERAAAHMGPALTRLVGLDGLLHDAAEAYPPGDVAAPLKRRLEAERPADWGGVLEYMERIDTAIRERFGLPPQMSRTVRDADLVLLATEARDLMAGDWMPDGVAPLSAPLRSPWSPQVAELRYLLRYRQLAGPGQVLDAVRRLLPDIGPPTAEYDRADHLLLRLLVGELDEVDATT